MIISFLIGLFLGVLYFGGLYYSTQKFNDVKSPALLMLISFILRMGILIVGLYYLAQLGYKNILVGFAAVMLVRFIIVFKVNNHPSNSVSERE